MVERAGHWDGIYDAKATDEVSWFEAVPEQSLRHVLGEETPGSVVDVGCGASLLVDELLDRGVGHVTLLDVAAGPLDVVRRRLGERARQVELVVSDVTAWDPPRAFDVWHDRAVFHFLTDPADQQAYAAVLARAVRPGGRAVVATFAEDGPERCSGLDVSRWDAESLAAALSGEVFDVATSERHVHRTPGGVEQPFTWLVLRRL
jgi:SAM-dependent methyltransferase